MRAPQTFRWSAQSGLPDTMGALFQKTQNISKDLPPYVIAWWCFTMAVSAANILEFFPGIPAPASHLLAIAGSAGCAWGWLMSRTLFRPTQKIERWVFLVVASVLVIEASWTLSGMNTTTPLMNEVHRMTGNAASLACISALFLILLEALSGFNALNNSSERRFRLQFIGGYAAMMSVSMVWAINAPEGTFAGHWQDAALASCGLAAIILSRLAVSYRQKNPLPVINDVARPARAPSPVVENEALKQRILQTIADERVFSRPNLKVADFANMIGEQEYIVTQYITGGLQFRNFNHLVNKFRIDRARTMLSLKQHEGQSILSIAYECGFNSIGPFNRAFKQATGMTPSEFRAARRHEKDAG